MRPRTRKQIRGLHSRAAVALHGETRRKQMKESTTRDSRVSHTESARERANIFQVERSCLAPERGRIW